MFAHGIMTGLFFALVGLVYEKAHSREIFKMGGFGAMMPGIATAFTIGGLSSLGLPATAGFVAEFLTFLGAWSSDHPLVAVPRRHRRLSHLDLRAARHRADLLGPEPGPALPASARRARTEWAALGILVFALVLFGVMPGSRSRRWIRLRCRSSNRALTGR